MSAGGTPKYMIGVAAELLGMHPQTLRMYEQRGLIRPRRTPGGTRLYSDDDLDRVRRVTQLASGLGLSLQGAEYVLSLEDQVVVLGDQREQQVDRSQLGVAGRPRALGGGLDGFLGLDGQSVEIHGVLGG